MLGVGRYVSFSDSGWIELKISTIVPTTRSPILIIATIVTVPIAKTGLVGITGTESITHGVSRRFTAASINAEETLW